MSRAGQQDQDSQDGEWMALRLDQFPLLLMVSLSDHRRDCSRLTVAAASAAATRTSAGSAAAVGSSTTSTTSTGASSGMGTAKAAAVRTVIAMPVNAAEPCLNTADVAVDQGAFRIVPRVHGVVFIQHETL